MTASSSGQEVPERAIGILALLGSFVFIYLGIYKPISDAANHEPTISFSMKAAIIAPLVFALGLVYTIFGPLTAGILGPRNRPSFLGWAFYIFFFILGFFVYSWVNSVVKGYGYDV